jgi:hypothetical protein
MSAASGELIPWANDVTGVAPAPVIEFLVRLMGNARQPCVRATERDISASLPAATPLLRNRRSGVGARKRYGKGKWRKRKGFAEIRLKTGETVRAELHWYEATGIGRREYKIKAFL